MKKILLTAILVFQVGAQAADQTNMSVQETAAARPNGINWGQVLRTAGAVAGVIIQNLERARLASLSNPSIQQQWDVACGVTKALNPGLIAFNQMLAENRINQRLCAPITPLIKLQTDIMANCEQFYSRPVPENARLMLGKFAITLFQSKMILTKCYPALAGIRLP